MWRKKLKKVIITYLIIVFIINSLFWIMVFLNIDPVNKFYEEGLIIKIDKLKYAMVFSHGNFRGECVWKKENISEPYNKKCIYDHVLHVENKKISTATLIDRLRKEGYEKIWLSACRTGDRPYMYYSEISNTTLEWKDYVSRNEKPGMTLVIFNGIWFTRLAI